EKIFPDDYALAVKLLDYYYNNKPDDFEKKANIAYSRHRQFFFPAKLVRFQKALARKPCKRTFNVATESRNRTRVRRDINQLFLIKFLKLYFINTSIS
ncbi:MAG: hypothetical protein Q7J06_03090, partial [Bacteroidales bacterium]|nr:hypothetical protein [Bacteroidales bacterium]